MEGPHGNVEALEAAHHADRVCFVAGGSGIAVTYPLAWDHQVQDHKQYDAIVDLRTVYRDGSKHSPAVLDCGSLVDTRKFAHFWVRQDIRHSRWISIVPKARAVQPTAFDKVSDKKVGAQSDNLEDITSIITQTFDTRQPGPDGGRPDMKSEVWDWVTSTGISSSSSSILDAQAMQLESGQSSGSSSISSQRQGLPVSLKERQKEKICIVVSGPDGLVRDIRNVVAQLVKEGWNMEIYVEKFGW